ncbi:hypothetical protein A3F66_06445 [candidate division TM6 bacterium RIFCSPHIGHO2_12_FULL_32_22]|nr:MAG: hypothetical protein A3F66_06445 [candidate division TM6 bacterium RIFCSPHIGHO2_12_FULL_32_22]
MNRRNLGYCFLFLFFFIPTHGSVDGCGWTYPDFNTYCYQCGLYGAGDTNCHCDNIVSDDTAKEACCAKFGTGGSVTCNAQPGCKWYTSPALPHCGRK